MRQGGMGLHRFSAAEYWCSAPFLSSAALAKVVMHGALEQVRRFDGPAGTRLSQEWFQLRNHVGLTDLRVEAVEAACVCTVLAQVQTDTSKVTAVK